MDGSTGIVAGGRLWRKREREPKSWRRVAGSTRRMKTDLRRMTAVKRCRAEKRLVVD
jgi:hypothetical protein